MIDIYHVDLQTEQATRNLANIALDYTFVGRATAYYTGLMPLSYTHSIHIEKGYIAGMAEGLVTVDNQPASRQILFMHADSPFEMQWAGQVWSKKTGNYLITNLDPSKQYLVLARDLKPINGSESFAPAGWDYVTPATDLTVAEQQQLWQSWQD